MASNKESKASRHLTTRATRRQVIKAGGIAALGLAFSKPIIETLRPRPVSAQVSPIGGLRGNGGQAFADILVLAQQIATIEESMPGVVMPFDGIIKTGNDSFNKSLRGMIQFDVSSRLGATITRAELFLTNILHTAPPATPIPHILHRIVIPWVGPVASPPPAGDATWNTHGSSSAFVTAGSDPTTAVNTPNSPPSFLEYSWDIKDIVQLWLDGTANHGVMLIGNESVMFQDSFVGILPPPPPAFPFTGARLEIDGTTGGGD